MKIKDIVTFVSKSVAPQRGTKYNLYSLPAFDEGKKAEILDGTEIQSNKYDVPDKCILFNKLNVRFKRVWRIDNDVNTELTKQRDELLPLLMNGQAIVFLLKHCNRLAYLV